MLIGTWTSTDTVTSMPHVAGGDDRGIYARVLTLEAKGTGSLIVNYTPLPEALKVPPIPNTELGGAFAELAAEMERLSARREPIPPVSGFEVSRWEITKIGPNNLCLFSTGRDPDCAFTATVSDTGALLQTSFNRRFQWWRRSEKN